MNRIQFNDKSSSNLVINPVQGTHKVKCKYGHNDKNSET